MFEEKDTKRILYVEDTLAHRFIVQANAKALFTNLEVDTAASFVDALGKVGVPAKMKEDIIRAESIGDTKRLFEGRENELSLDRFRDYSGFLVDNDITGSDGPADGKGRHLAKLFNALHDISGLKTLPVVHLITNSLPSAVFPKGKYPEGEYPRGSLDAMKKYGIARCFSKSNFRQAVLDIGERHGAKLKEERRIIR